MYEEEFSNRLMQLRCKKGVSARDMSLSIGQNPGYINNIETGKALPSMSSFFFICEYLDITPSEFFDFESELPIELRTLIDNIKHIDSSYIKDIAHIVEGLNK